MELAVPLVVLLMANMSLRGGLQRRLVRFMWGILLAATVATFALFEYFRSWTYYRLHTTSSYFDFVLGRFAGYYTTALNNGQLVLDHQRWPNRLPYDTIEALWVAPGIESAQLYEEPVVMHHRIPESRRTRCTTTYCFNSPTPSSTTRAAIRGRLPTTGQLVVLCASY